MKCILAGHGYWGSVIERYLAGAGFEIKYVYTRSSDVSFEQMCLDEEVEACFICTPAAAHYKLAKTALQNGKHVFCEKMLTGNIRKAKELFDMAETEGRILFTDYIYQYSPSIIKMKEEMGRLGEELTGSFNISQYGKFYDDADVMENIGVHMISCLGFFTGFSENIEIESFNMTDKVSAEMKVSVSYDRGRVCDICAPVPGKEEDKGIFHADIIASLTADEKIRRIEIKGEKGQMSFDMRNKPILSISCGDEKTQYDRDENNNLKAALAAFAKMSAGEDKEIWEQNKKCSLYVENVMDAVKRGSR